MSEVRTMGPDPKQQTLMMWGQTFVVPLTVIALVDAEIKKYDAEIEAPSHVAKEDGNAKAHRMNRLRTERGEMVDFLKGAKRQRGV